jgi:hypothetical protein
MIYISSASGRYKFVVAFENSRCGRDSLTRRLALAPGWLSSLEPLPPSFGTDSRTSLEP